MPKKQHYDMWNFKLLHERVTDHAEKYGYWKVCALF